MDTKTLPTTLLEAIQYFSDSRTCVEFVKNLHWPDGKVACPRCSSEHVKELATRQIWKCYGCKKQFSAKVGTIFEQSPLSLSKWLPALWLITNAKNGISSCEVARALGVCQKTAWFMLHRIREAMANGTFKKFTGVVEADETFVGGSDRFRHAHKKDHKRGRGSKTPVMGMVERGGKVIASVIDSQTEKHLKSQLRKYVERESVLYTDSFSGYRGLGKDYYRSTINHKEGEYVRGDVHTNTIEGFWSLFKRCYKGTYIHMAPFHLDRYLSEQCFRYNARKNDDGGRMEVVTSQVFGARLTWKELTGKANAV